MQKLSYRESLKLEEVKLNLSTVQDQIRARKVVVWGAGTLAEYVSDVLKELLDVVPILYVDWSENNTGKEIRGVEIVTPSYFRHEVEYRDCFVIVAASAWRNAGCVLRNMGFENLKDFVVAYCGFRNQRSLYRDEDLGSLVFVGQRTSTFDFIQKSLIQYRLIGWPITKVGAYSSIAIGAAIVQNHPMYATTSSYFFANDDRCFEENFRAHNDPTEVGNDVWLGRNAIILPGVRVGNGAIVGAGAIVTKDVPDYAVVVGNPARVIRYRFEPEAIELFNTAQWWNWRPEKVEKYKSLFTQEDVSEFLAVLQEMVDNKDYF